MNKREMVQLKAALTTEAEGLLASMTDGTADVTAVSRASELESELTNLEETIRRHDEALEKAKVRMAQQTRQPAQVHDNREEKPFESFGHFLVSISRSNPQSGSMDPRLRKYASGGNEGVGSEGGFLVDSQVAPGIYESVYEASDLLSLCNVIPIGDGYNGVKINGIDETSRVAGSRWGGVRAYWAAEAATVTASAPKFRRVELEMKKLMALYYATGELLQDATALGGVISEVIPQELAFSADDAIINGTGAGMPLGVLNSGAFVAIAAEGAQTAATVNWANVSKMFGRMPTKYVRNATWLINGEVYAQILLLASAATSAAMPMFVPPGTGAATPPFGTLYGRPIKVLEQCAALGTVGDIILADMKQYLIASKGGITGAQSMHVRFLYDEEVFRFTYRLDGTPRLNSAITPFKGSATVSPFLGIATRS